MKKRRLLITFLVAALLLAASLLLFWNHYDLSKVQPDLRVLNRPFQRVLAYYYFDGGSIGVEILDRDGTRCALRLPEFYSSVDDTKYTSIYIGATSIPKGASPRPLDIDTKRFLIEVIDGSEPGLDRDSALRSLREDTFGEGYYFLKKLKGIPRKLKNVFD